MIPPLATEQIKITSQGSLSAHAESFPKARFLPEKHSLQEKEPCRGTHIPQLQPREAGPGRSCTSWAPGVLQNTASTWNHTVTPTKSFPYQKTALAADSWLREQFFYHITSCHGDQLVQAWEGKKKIRYYSINCQHKEVLYLSSRSLHIEQSWK